MLLCGHELFNVVGNFSIRFMGDLGRETITNILTIFYNVLYRKF